MTLSEHLSNKTSPKRILALDGGGIRGALTLGYLQRIEISCVSKTGTAKISAYPIILIL
jgi:patatin-like phospholipase/acyl hydrolase